MPFTDKNPNDNSALESKSMSTVSKPRANPVKNMIKKDTF
jgi:hypothetical protein